MIKHRQLLFLLALVVLGVAAYQVQVTRASAENMTTVSVVEEAKQALPEATLDPNTPEGKIAQEIEALVNKWAVPIVQRAGWLHVVEHHDRNLDDAGELPSGQPIPVDYIKDAWYLLDGQGSVLKAVSWMKDLSETVIQETVFANNTWFNLTTGESLEVGPFSLRLDFGFSENAGLGPEWYSAISRSEAMLDGKPVLLFTIRDNIEGSGELDGLSQDLRLTTLETRAYFIPDGGKLLALETVGVDASGKEHSLDVVRFLSLERGSPPGEVFALLEEASQ